MNLNQLQYFKVLAQEEHYTRAAQILSITQPSLSHAIAQLEEELGTRLFEKKGRNIVLTRYGKLFLPYVEESLKVLEEGVQRTRELNGSKEGIIHLAYIYTMGSNFTPKMVRNFLDTYQDYHIDFHFTVGTTGDILAGLKEDKYDVIVSNPPYIKREVIKKLNKDVQKEPIIALDGGYDGLDFYRKIINESEKYLKFNGYLCFEIGYDQKEDVIGIIKNKERYINTYSKKDLYGNDRIIITKLS